MIYRESHRERRRDDDEVFGDDEEGEDGMRRRIPPHEYLAKQLGRTRIASWFSVHERIRRTLKGRDLSRVRDAIWEKIGFED
ncbi:hypothetical protein GIB67_027639 [Kingdonia uniflora]|uniref:Uncharacterized protein n=1 Tax=Kingdonia uniflora TaxID=39325 RepID=A0A7J7NKT1_9MAGN|nr:hypothetical protein GIB67_027639 [Kingdonia uniflora]